MALNAIFACMATQLLSLERNNSTNGRLHATGHDSEPVLSASSLHYCLVFTMRLQL